MSIPEVDVRAAIEADTILRSLVVPVTGDSRVYPLQLEQGTLFPAITIRRVAGSTDLVHGQVTPGVSLVRLSFRLYSEEMRVCHQMRSALIGVLRGFKVASINDGPTDIEADRQPPVFCIVVDARMWYTDN